MWELEDTQHYVTSKIGCWQALDAAVELHDAGMIDGPREKWIENRELIETWVSENGWDESAATTSCTRGPTRWTPRSCCTR